MNQREHADEEAAVRARTFQPQRAAMNFGNPTRDREAESRSVAVQPRARRIDAKETVEDLLAELGRNARTFVAHLDAGEVAVREASDADFAARLRVADRVL